MFLKQLDEKQKEQFLNLCNLLVDCRFDYNMEGYDKAVETIKSYCREMEIPYSETAEGTFKRVAFELAEMGNPKVLRIIAFALISIFCNLDDYDNGVKTEILKPFLTYADINIEEFMTLKSCSAKFVYY